MSTALIYVATSGGFLLLLTTLFMLEDARGQRLLLDGLRERLDRGTYRLFTSLSKFTKLMWHGVVAFVLHYFVHSFLGAVGTYLSRLEKRVEQVIWRSHRARLRERTGRNHLDEIADHKESVALTDAQKKKIREH